MSEGPLHRDTSTYEEDALFVDVVAGCLRSVVAFGGTDAVNLLPVMVEEETWGVPPLDSGDLKGSTLLEISG